MSEAVDYRWSTCIESARSKLVNTGVTNAERELRWMVEEICGARFDRCVDATVTPDQYERFTSMVDRRSAGEPLQYVFGHWPFRSLDLLVDPRALIPRAETELVAQVALDEAAQMADGTLQVVDLGTGSGAVALSIACESGRSNVWAVDRSAAALALAAQNLQRVEVARGRVEFLAGSWFEPLPTHLRGSLDLIVTNPPYVASGDAVEESVLDWEPADALFAGDDGLDDLRVIIASAPDWLAVHGVLVAEIGATQGSAVVDLARDAGFTHAAVRADLAGRDRILVATRQR